MSWYEELDRWTADYLPDMIYEHDAALAKYTSFRIGGPARRMAFPKDGSQMVLLIEAARGCGARPLVIGNGTNLLFPDEGVDRLGVNTRDMSCVVLDAEGRVTAEAGVPLARAAVFAQKQGLTGLEFAHGIPGSVGGAVCMNAGAYGGEMQQVVHSATVLFPDDGVRTLRGEELRFSYRHSLLTDRPEAVVLRVVFQLTAGRPEEIRQKMEELMTRRKTSQPLEYPSAGSTFKRQEGYFAAALIDQRSRPRRRRARSSPAIFAIRASVLRMKAANRPRSALSAKTLRAFQILLSSKKYFRCSSDSSSHAMRNCSSRSLVSPAKYLLMTASIISVSSILVLLLTIQSSG